MKVGEVYFLPFLCTQDSPYKHKLVHYFATALPQTEQDGVLANNILIIISKIAIISFLLNMSKYLILYIKWCTLLSNHCAAKREERRKGMITEEWFRILIFVSVLLPLTSLIMLSLLSVGEKEIDYLQLENARVRLEKELQQSKYMQLHQQIQPHFLFNTLNAFISLARLGKNEEMVKGMEHLSLFLRYSYQSKEALIPIKEELAHTKNYLAIQKLRFGRKLTALVRVDKEAERALIPPYTLQTLVENAFKHGLEKKIGEKYIEITLSREGNWLYLRVCDNGNEGQAVSVEKGGIGLDNLRKRFNLLFDMPTRISLQKNKRDLTEALIVWPYVPGEER